ncbi:MAG: hypothetical protein R3B93_25175 [Bacteroidia bacterium]
MRHSELGVAFQENDQISIERKALEICMEFGDRAADALAALLSHEIAHYLYHHETIIAPSAYATRQNQEKDQPELEEIIRVEDEADTRGVFLAARAGYRTEDILPDLLDLIYKKYQLPENLPGYPSLTERKKQAVLSGEKARDLADLFEMSNLLTMVGQYQEAAIIYNYLNDQHVSQSFLNNIGLSYALQVIEKLKHQDSVIYPFEIDPYSRLGDKIGRSSPPDLSLIDTLKMAIFYFKRSIQLNPEYLPGLVNYSCAQILLAKHGIDEYEKQEALNQAETAIQSAQNVIDYFPNRFSPKDRAQVGMARAIIYQSLGKKKEVKLILKEVGKLKMNDPGWEQIYLHNKKLLGNHKVSLNKWQQFSSQEIIPEDFPTYPFEQVQKELPVGKELAIKQKPYIFARIKDTLDRRILIYQRRAYRPDLQIFLYQATNQYQGKTTVGSVSVGDSIDKISGIYGRPNKRIESVHGYYLVYDQYKIIFFIRNEKVEEWTLYYVL